MSENILSILILIPIFGAGFIILFTRDDNEVSVQNAKYVALWTSMVTFVVSLSLWFYFENTSDFQFIEKYTLISDWNINYHLGIDGISLFMILLSTLLTPICLVLGWNSIKVRAREYLLAFLILESLLIGVFSVLDIFLFYVFFEAILIPMFLIIGIWGGENRIYAAYKFFIYTFLGSVLFLVSLIFLNQNFGTSSMLELAEYAPKIEPEIQKYLWLAMFASFAIKVPMWPVHTWLPDAHVQAPTAGSVILAGILLKLGAYGFLRFSIPMLPDASVYFADFVYYLSVIALILTSLVAFAQTDMKKLIAYSSVAHMGYVTAGIFTFNIQGMTGAIMQMISHGIVSGALFMCVGVLYERFHTKEIAKYGGLVNRMPVFAAFFMLFTMASVGLPGTSGFIGEFLVIVGIFEVSSVLALLLASGMVLGAVYALSLYKRVSFGELSRNELKKAQDLDMREKLMFLPLIIMVIWIGVYPKSFTGSIEVAVQRIASFKQTTELAEGGF